jgi:uncharacterized protein (TIGR03084 family)
VPYEAQCTAARFRTVAGSLASLVGDLRDESDDLDVILDAAGARGLDTPTPARGWTVGDTLGHLWFFDREGRRALEDPEAFNAGLAAILADPGGYVDRHIAEIRTLGESLLTAWREERRLIIEALGTISPTTRVPWYGRPMSPLSFTTARLMETWAHGQDIADALGVRRKPTDRLRQIADLGIRTRGFSYEIKGRSAPDVPVFVVLTGPSGETWEWGPRDAPDRVSGPALDFCLLVTQRRVLDDLGLTVGGDAAAEWMTLAQAFAGAPSLTDEGRRGL